LRHYLHGACDDKSQTANVLRQIIQRMAMY
jgi:hypothetical protein